MSITALVTGWTGLVQITYVHTYKCVCVCMCWQGEGKEGGRKGEKTKKEGPWEIGPEKKKKRNQDDNKKSCT